MAVDGGRCTGRGNLFDSSKGFDAMDKSEMISLGMQGYECAQCVVKAFEDVLGDSTGTVVRSVACMSMGLLQGSVCGGVLGALAVIGHVFGKDEPDHPTQGLCMIKREQFFMEFRKRRGEITCPGILGLDVRINEDNIKANATGVYTDKCPEMFLEIVDITRKVIG